MIVYIQATAVLYTNYHYHGFQDYVFGIKMELNSHVVAAENIKTCIKIYIE